MGNNMTVLQMTTGARGRSEFSEEETQQLLALAEIIEHFRLIRNTMSVHLVEAFVKVAAKEGLPVKDYATQQGVAHSVMSRHLLDLSDTLRTGHEGLKLLRRRQNIDNLKETEYRLTPQGTALARGILKTLSKAFHKEGQAK